ncbi:MAG: hypothetical protein ACK4NW_02275 [Roseinatronobacter sp.]
MTHIALILLAVGANIVLNLALRQTSRGMDLSSIAAGAHSLLLSPWMWLSLLSGTILIAAFMGAIRNYSLSITYVSVTASAMVALTVIGVMFHHEQASLGRMLGLGLIVAGLILTLRAA